MGAGPDRDGGGVKQHLKLILKAPITLGNFSDNVHSNRGEALVDSVRRKYLKTSRSSTKIIIRHTLFPLVV